MEGTKFDDKQQSDDAFFQYVAESYSYFLAHEDDKSRAVDDRMALEISEQHDAARAHLESLTQVWDAC